jgi:hypothetical protein
VALAIQLINAILLMSAGFIAGNWYSSGTDRTAGSAEASMTIASTSAPKTAVTRGPASVPSVSATTPGTKVVNSAPPVDLAAYLLRFAITDVHEACDFAHNRFLDQTVSAHARFIDSLENAGDHKSYLESLGQHLAEGEKFWVGKGDLILGDGLAQFEVVMDSHSFLPEADDEDNTSCFRAHLHLTFPNGHDFSTVLDACSDSIVTKNSSYYLNWESFGDVEVGRKLAVVQIPLPESAGELEFMRASDQQWAKAQAFRWESVPLDQGLQMIDAFSPSLAENRPRAEP